MKTYFRANPLDAAVTLVVITCLIGFFLAHKGYAGVNQVLKGQTTVSIDLFLPNVRSTNSELFKVGDKTALTVRNQPVYPPFTITAVKKTPRLVAFPSPGGKALSSFVDPSQPYANDYLVTVSDQAEITNDGYVIHGNKIKIGNQIEIEGFKYRIPGTVLDLRPQ
jgi:hypothetical protein